MQVSARHFAHQGNLSDRFHACSFLGCPDSSHRHGAQLMGMNNQPPGILQGYSRNRSRRGKQDYVRATCFERLNVVFSENTFPVQRKIPLDSGQGKSNDGHVQGVQEDRQADNGEGQKEG